MWSYNLIGSVKIVQDRVCSKSYIAVLNPEDKQKVISDIDALLQRKDGLTWIDEQKGIFEYPYQTFLVIARKK